MALFYKASDKELITLRHKIFKETGIPELEKNGFVKSPFSTAWFGEYDRNISGYSYEFCRLSKHNHLEIISVYTVKGDKWIQIHLNIFKLEPHVNSLNELDGIDGMQFHLSPNNGTNMRLRIDDFKGMPLFRFTEHKLGTYYTKNGFEREVEKLRDLIKKDMTNIDHFVKRWHELHKPLFTDWKGNPIE